MWETRFGEQIDDVLDAALWAVTPAPLVRASIAWEPHELRIGCTAVPREGLHRVHVVAAGKASRGMALGALAALGDEIVVTGTLLIDDEREWGAPNDYSPLAVRVVRPRGWNRPTVEAEAATRGILGDVRELGPSDVLLVLISGGGSAMLTAPRAPVTLREKVETIGLLDAAGAPIALLNAVRRRLSGVKGGRLAAAASGARAVVGLLISDVDGDDPAVIASGPLTGGPDASVVEQLRSLGVLDALAPSVRQALDAPLPTASAPCHVVATPRTALDGMVPVAQAHGFRVVDLGRVSGPVDDVVSAHVNAARGALRDGPPDARPSCIISAGESTLVLPPDRGDGGRVTHLALALAVALEDDEITRGTWSLGACPSDGEDAALTDVGVLFDARALESVVTDEGIDVREALRRCDSASVVDPYCLGSRPPERRSNVQDLRIVVVAGTADDRARWDERHSAPGYRRGGRPTTWLAEVTQHLPAAGRALDVACGDGGDVVHLAELGLEVTGVDISAVGLAKARALAESRGVADRVHLVEHDLSRSAPPLRGTFDVIAISHFHDPLLVQAVLPRLAANGWLVMEVATRENLALGLPSPPERYLAGRSELLHLATGLVVRRYREDEIDGMVRAQLLAQNSRPWDYPHRDEADDETGTDGNDA